MNGLCVYTDCIRHSDILVSGIGTVTSLRDSIPPWTTMPVWIDARVLCVVVVGGMWLTLGLPLMRDTFWERGPGQGTQRTQ